MVEELLQRGLSINAGTPGAITPFALAAKAQNVELVKTMMRRERPDQRSLDEALLLTPMTGENPLVPLLLESGADINSRQDIGFATDPLLAAARRWRFHREEDLLWLLIRHRADPNRTPSGRNESALTTVLANPALAMAMLDLGADVAWRDAQGRTALHRISSTRRQDPTIDLEPGDRARLAAALLARGADPNAQDRQGHTPLMFLTADQEQTMDVLLQAGGTVHIGDGDWHSWRTDPTTGRRVPMSRGTTTWLLLEGDDPLAEALLRRAGKLDEEDCGAVYHAAAFGAERTLAALLDLKAPTELVSENSGLTPLMAAAASGQAGTIRILLDRHAARVEDTSRVERLSVREIAQLAANGIFVTAQGGQTALLLAVGGGRAQAVDELLRHGADPNHADASGVRPLRIARSMEQSGRAGPEISAMLLSHGARE